MSSVSYVPDRGDVIWIVLDPRVGQVGHEQSGRRPAIVLSPRLFSGRTGLAVICPITSKIKGLPFEIVLKSENIDGAILPVHLRSVDINDRKAQFIEKAPATIIKKVAKTVELLISP